MAKEHIVIDDIEEDGGSEIEGRPAKRLTAKRVETPPKPQVQAKVLPKDWARIRLEENDAIPPTGLFLGLNGQSYILRPGRVASVPPGIINILNDAVMTVAAIDPDTLKVVGWRDRLRFPYQLISAQAA